ncbi:YwdI family protein [Lentibacillus sp. L22]|uniref:YwdI family protein n=1 Tax=Lentibacillus sp. L22 TaxID=3163028 RepID=UPI003464FE6D
MSVTDQTVLQRIIREAQQAREKQTSHKKMIEHIKNVKLLCELLLENTDEPTATTNDITANEMKAMMGKTYDSPRNGQLGKQSEFDDDGANGESIFDF